MSNNGLPHLHKKNNTGVQMLLYNLEYLMMTYRCIHQKKAHSGRRHSGHNEGQRLLDYKYKVQSQDRIGHRLLQLHSRIRRILKSRFRILQCTSNNHAHRITHGKSTVRFFDRIVSTCCQDCRMRMLQR